MIKLNTLHGVALGAVMVVAGESLLGSFRHPIGSTIEHVMQPLFALTFWSFLLWKLWKRPQRWSLIVEGLFLLMIVFQTWLWQKGMANPTLRSMAGPHPLVEFILDEIPLIVATIACFMLWRRQRRLCAGANG